MLLQTSATIESQDFPTATLNGVELAQARRCQRCRWAGRGRSSRPQQSPDRHRRLSRGLLPAGAANAAKPNAATVRPHCYDWSSL